MSELVNTKQLDKTQHSGSIVCVSHTYEMIDKTEKTDRCRLDGSQLEGRYRYLYLGFFGMCNVVFHENTTIPHDHASFQLVKFCCEIV